MVERDNWNLVDPFMHVAKDEAFGYLKKVIVTSAVDSRLLESLQINIQSTEQNSLSVNISKRLSESSVLIKQSDSIRL